MKTLAQVYQDFRKTGHSPVESLRNAKVCLQWTPLEYNDKVRLTTQEESENYFSVYGEPEGCTDGNGRYVPAEKVREDIVETIRRLGCVAVISQYFDESTESWKSADSIGMCICEKPESCFENPYVCGLMKSAIDAYLTTAISPVI